MIARCESDNFLHDEFDDTNVALFRQNVCC